jgi:hypothetical protein
MIQATRRAPCPICQGHRDMPPGKGVRCFGFVSDDGTYAHCTRDELAGGMPQHKDATYVHRLAGPCKCGATHGEAVVEIGSAAREIVATYDYTDPSGAISYQVVRFHPKNFRQRKPDGAGGWTWKLDGVAPLLYRLPEVLGAVAAEDVVWICEGEKDVDAMRAAGHVATCNSGGAGKWPASGTRHLTGADVVIVRDKDEPGTEHARKVFAALRPIAKSLRVVEARAGKDAADHLAAKHTAAEFVPVWPAGDLRLTDPVAWKRRALRMAMDATDPIREVDAASVLARAPEPTWPTGLEGEPSALRGFRGVVILAGVTSSAKSYLSLASGVQAAWAGWDVQYCQCEMSEAAFARRLEAYCRTADANPERFHHLDVSYGVSIDTLIGWLEQRVSERPTLIVLDSLTSFCDQAIEQNAEDPHNATLSKRLVMWAINVRRATQGEIAFLLLAEASKEGRVRGRTADHKADMALLLESPFPKNTGTKRITVTKSWEGETGLLGEFSLDISTARMTRL